MSNLLFPRALILVLLFSSAVTSVRAGNAEHVVIIVWDGLRPDCINERDTPKLSELTRQGVFFKNHHAVYLSSTEVNAAALATGDFPYRNGILGNREYRPEIDPLKPVEVDSAYVVRKGDELTGGHYLPVPTLPEIVRAAGGSVAVVGNKPVPRLFDRNEPNSKGHDAASLMATLPTDAVKRIAKSNREIPADSTPQGKLDAMATRALVFGLWGEAVPKLSLLWLSEPDMSQHQFGPGSKEARTAIQNCDASLGLVMSELTARGLRSNTDVFVVSDHGFSTINRTVAIPALLRKVGFRAETEFQAPPTNGDIMVVNEGGSVLLCVIGHDEVVTRKLVEFFQQQDFTGVLFTRQPMPGTFTLAQVKIDTAHAPDLVVSLKWSADRNTAGLAGMLVVDGPATSYAARGGAHGSLSRFDMQNTLIAAGSDFRAGAHDDLPSSNADLAPTILSVLGINPPQPMDGRVLSEEMPGGSVAWPPPTVSTLNSESRSAKSVWRQSLRLTQYGGTVYIDEGNGSVTPQ